MARCTDHGPDEAKALWAHLQTAHPSQSEWNDALVKRGQEVSGHGSARAHAEFLRELYALPGPLSSEQAFFERLLLPELARVLGVIFPASSPSCTCATPLRNRCLP